MLQDPIADMLTRIRNANALGNPSLEMPSSTMKAGIAKILQPIAFTSLFSWIRSFLADFADWLFMA